MAAPASRNPTDPMEVLESFTAEELEAVHEYARAVVAGRRVMVLMLQIFTAIGIVAGAVYSVVYVWQAVHPEHRLIQR